MLVALDFALVGSVSYWLIGLLNDRRGLTYLGFLTGTMLIIVGTSYLSLPGLRYLAFIALVMMVVGLPLIIREKLDSSNPISSLGLHSRSARVTLSALFAVVILAFTLGQNTRIGELGQAIVIEAVNQADGTSANLGNQTEVAVVIMAKRDRWASIEPDELTATVDVGNRREGTHELPINISIPDEKVKIIRLKPARVTVKVEPVISKTVSLVARFSGRAAGDLVPDEPQFVPDKVEISGAKSVVADIVQLSVPININGLTGVIEQKFSPLAHNSNGEIIGNLTVTPKEVSTKVALVKAGKIKTVGIRPNITGTPGVGYWVRSATVEPSTASVTGSVELLEKLSEILTDPISVAGLTENKTFTPQLVVSGVSLAVLIEKVTVKIELANLPTSKSINPEIVYNNLAGSLKVTSLEPSNLTVIMAGSSNLLNNFLGSEVKLNLDLAPYKTAGKYSLLITNDQFKFPEGIALVSFLPSAIDLTLDNR